MRNKYECVYTLRIHSLVCVSNIDFFQLINSPMIIVNMHINLDIFAAMKSYTVTIDETGTPVEEPISVASSLCNLRLPIAIIIIISIVVYVIGCLITGVAYKAPGEAVGGNQISGRIGKFCS